MFTARPSNRPVSRRRRCRMTESRRKVEAESGVVRQRVFGLMRDRQLLASVDPRLPHSIAERRETANERTLRLDPIGAERDACAVHREEFMNWMDRRGIHDDAF